MRVARILIAGVLGGLLVTAAAVKMDNIVSYSKSAVTGKLTDDQTQEIYYKVVKATGQSGIVPALTISNQTVVNAYTTSQGITMFRGLLDQLNADEAALVLGHEVSHFLLGHVFVVTPQSTDQIRVEEMQADKYGAFLALRAGYSVCEGRKFFKMLSTEYGDNQDQDHPDFAFRYDQLDMNCGG